MSSKSTPRSAASKSFAADPLRESAHEIWLAGLGAFTKAQQEGSKMYDTLVQEGLAMQRKAQTTAEEKLNEAGEKVSSLARDLETRATSQWDKLESLFEDRVARAMQRLGIPSARVVHGLTTRLTELEKQLQARAARAAPAKKATTAKKATPAKKAPLKKTAAKKASPAKKAAPRKTARK